MYQNEVIPTPYSVDPYIQILSKSVKRCGRINFRMDLIIIMLLTDTFCKYCVKVGVNICNYLRFVIES